MIPVPLLAVLAAALAALETITRSGQLAWLAVPAVLFLAARCRARGAVALVAAVMLGVAYLPAAFVSRLSAEPAPWLAVAVVLGSLAVLVATRERLEHERDQLGNVALTDPLTALANRRFLLDRAEYEVARHRRARRSFAVVMLDLDGFKPLNDRFGHAAGDDLLREVADALGRAMRAQDTVARWGGDEFCVLAPETGAAGVERLTARVESAVGSVVAGTHGVSASLGVAVFPEDGTEVQRLLAAADERLLAVKRRRQQQRRRAA